MLVIGERLQRSDDIIKRRRQQKSVTVDFIQRIVGLNEDRLGGFTAKRRLADAFVGPSVINARATAALLSSSNAIKVSMTTMTLTSLL